jgi:hypothetical protein
MLTDSLVNKCLPDTTGKLLKVMGDDVIRGQGPTRAQMASAKQNPRPKPPL